MGNEEGLKEKEGGNVTRVRGIGEGFWVGVICGFVLLVIFGVEKGGVV